MATDKEEAWKKIKDGAKAAMDMAGQTAKEWKDEAAATAKTLQEPGNTPRKKAAMKKIAMAAGLVAVLLILASLLSGPSLSCDDSEVTETVSGLVREKVQQLAGNIGELAMIFEDPSSSEVRDMVSQLKNMTVKVNRVQETSRNDQAKRCSCSADLTISLAGHTDNQKVLYTVSDTDKGLYVEIDPVSLFRR